MRRTDDHAGLRRISLANVDEPLTLDPPSLSPDVEAALASAQLSSEACPPEDEAGDDAEVGHRDERGWQVAEIVG